MTPEQLGQQSSVSRFDALRDSPSKNTAISPASLQDQNSHSRWTADFLKDLRTNRPARPGGARPLPFRNDIKDVRTASPAPERASSAMGMRGPLARAKEEVPERSASALGSRKTQTTMGPRELPGRPVVKPPTSMRRNVSGSTTNTDATTSTSQTRTSQASRSSTASDAQKYSIPYYERGQRWMERQEMSSLRNALEDKDIKEEQRLHDAAQDEAADLVWKHQNPEAPYENPDKQNYRTHLRKGSHARTLSNGPFESLFVTKGGSAEGSRSASDGSESKNSGRSFSNGSQESKGSASGKGTTQGRYSSLSFSMRSRRFFGKKNSLRSRNVSGGSGKSMAKKPNVQIYEEPADVTVTLEDVDRPAPLKVKPRNTSYGTRSIKDKIAKIEGGDPTQPSKRVSVVEIHKNPPSQSRNADYKVNIPSTATPEKAVAQPEEDKRRSRDEIEIRSEDIRSATSMRLKDRSPKLPTPAVVSDRPRRPIVSFDTNWKPKEKELKHEGHRSDLMRNKQVPSKPPIPHATASAPVIPTINFPDTPCIQFDEATAIPIISLPDDPIAPSIPTIAIDDTPTIGISTPSISISPSIPTIIAPTSSTRPLPQPSKRHSPFTRPLPTHANTSPTKSAPHWTPHPLRTTAQCAACALPIAGKIVTASSQRFHPACFTCFHCGEQLECVAFYPEPERHRSERLARIEARLHNLPIAVDQAHFTEQDDGDEALRFYCHLDFHEKFSPRCRSCKTPIEGEVILACGGEWHVGHFFCAECGDPFEQNTPFVEKDGYAWCVGCHTKRYSGKCAGCRKPIVDMVVSALGREWHAGCFVCSVSFYPQCLFSILQIAVEMACVTDC